MSAQPESGRAQVAARNDGDSPLRICILSYRGNPHSGGQGVYVANLSAALTDLGHQVTVLSGPPYPVLDKRVRLETIAGLNLFDGRDRLSAFKMAWLLSPLALWEWLSALSGGFPEPRSYGVRALAWLRDKGADYDVVHDNQSLCSSLLKIQRLLPLVTTVHHPITRDLDMQLSHAKNFWHRLLIRRWHDFLPMQKRVTPRLKHLLTPSQSARQDIVDDFGADPERISVVPLGVDQDIFQPMARADKDTGDTADKDTAAQGGKAPVLRIVTTTSADVPLKGLHVLLQALAIIKDSGDKEIDEHVRDGTLELSVVGRPKSDGRTIGQLQALDLGGQVRFVTVQGPQDIAALYASAAVAVVPSLYEGFGLPAVEAMACGVALLVSDGGSLPEVVGEAGIVVPAGDAEALAKQLLRLLKDAKLRKKLAAAGLERAQKRYSWQRTAERTVDLYRRAIQDFQDGGDANP